MRRRTFLKGATVAGAAIGIGFDMSQARAEMRQLQIARHIKTSRDKTFVTKNAKGQTVNRNPSLAVVGGCTDTNEFNFLQWKFIEALGVTYRDSQARV